MPTRSLLARRVADVLGPAGPIAERLPHYESRPAQVEMATTIASALESGQHAVCEGGTGIGKTLSYLVPAIYSGKKVIVSTANKALQDQLVGKDIPFLQHVLPREVSAALVKGRSNYLCLDRLDMEEQDGGLFGPLPAVHALKAWAATTHTGDFEEMRTLPPRDLVTRVASTMRTCVGTACAHYHACFVEHVRAQAEDARIVVCNHALLLADLVLRDLGAHLLPDRDAVVVDEAHRLEDAALSAFSATLTRRDVEELTESPLLRRYAGEETARTLLALAERLFRPFELVPSTRPDPIGETLDAGLDLASSLEETSGRLRRRNPFESAPPSRESRHYENLVMWTARLAEDARLVSAQSDDDCVRYISFEGPSHTIPRLHWTPTDVAAPLRDLLFGQTPVICTSATLSIGPSAPTATTPASTGDFSYFRRAVGLDEAIELVAPSPFDYPSQALLYLPAHLPEFRGAPTPEYAAAVADEIEALTRASDGRAFVLFTSYRGLEDAYARLRDRLPFTLLKQGTLPRGELLRRFREDGAAVLFATRGFWEGIDVVGAALSLVVIDRIPFGVPDDPVLAARLERAAAEGQDPFTDLSLPAAILQLKQGVGRLIRSREDRGVVAILDSRLARRAYGRRIIAALPPAQLTHEIEEIRLFYDAARPPVDVRGL